MAKKEKKSTTPNIPAKGKNSYFTFELSNGDEVKVNRQQYNFVQEYLKDSNATQAAIRAGYSKNGANSVGSRMLANDNIRRLIDDYSQKLSDNIVITTERILKETALIAFGKATAKGALTNTHKLKALELLGRHKKLFTDKLEVETGAGQQEKVKAMIVDFKAILFSAIEERKR